MLASHYGDVESRDKLHLHVSLSLRTLGSKRRACLIWRFGSRQNFGGAKNHLVFRPHIAFHFQG